MDIHPKSTLLMIGDSITDCGRARPIGEGASETALGNGYVRLIQGLLSATYPDYGIRIINMGISGNTVRDLKRRWQTDVLDLQPDWLSIMIGINDVWRQFDTQYQMEEHVSIDEYSRTLDELIGSVRSELKGLVLMTPFFIEVQRSDPMLAMMRAYANVVRRIAEQYQAQLVDTQAAFEAVLQFVPPMQLAADRVHPGTVGHMVLARAFLRAVGYCWDR